MRLVSVAILFGLAASSCTSATEPATAVDEPITEERLEQLGDLAISEEQLDLIHDEAIRRAELDGGATLTVADTRILDGLYERCSLERGVDPGGVQIIWSEAGEPDLVKTGIDVPAEVHSFCWDLIGGDPNGRSSWNEDGTG